MATKSEKETAVQPIALEELETDEQAIINKGLDDYLWGHEAEREGKKFKEEGVLKMGEAMIGVVEIEKRGVRAQGRLLKVVSADGGGRLDTQVFIQKLLEHGVNAELIGQCKEEATTEPAGTGIKRVRVY